jgi:hypothetical protein
MSNPTMTLDRVLILTPFLNQTIFSGFFSRGFPGATKTRLKEVFITMEEKKMVFHLVAPGLT